MRLLSQGAEARIYMDKNEIVKIREPKGYRLPELDSRLRKERTRREAKILASSPVPGPKLIAVDEKSSSIRMQFLEGDRLRDILEKRDYVNIMNSVGKQVACLHDKGIIHGDLTTSNLIWDGSRVFFIDFGLSFASTREEDMAVDMHLLHQALESRHHRIKDECLAAFIAGYGADRPSVKRLRVVEARGRNKH